MKLITETNEQYHARPELSASMLKKLDESPRIFEAWHVTKTIGSRPTDAMKLGTAVHAAILEPRKFDEDYVVCPPDCSDKRTKKHKEWAATVEGQEVLTLAEHDRIMDCYEAATTNSAACDLLTSANDFEKSFLYEDPHTGVPCRVRFDALTADTIVDIKTVADGSEDAFIKSVAKYRYHLQAAHYLEGLRAITGEAHWRFAFITVETSAPFRCRVFELDSDSLAHAECQRTSLLEDYKRRSLSGDWSEPGEHEITQISLPTWAIMQQPLDWSGVDG